MLPHHQIPNLNRTDRRPHQLPHAAADRFQHPAHLAIPSLGNLDFEKRALVLIAHPRDLSRLRGPVIQVHALAQLLKLLISQHARRFHQVRLRHLAFGIHHVLCELRVIRQNQQAAGVEIQPAHGNHILRYAFQQIVNRRPAFRILVSGEIAFRLIQQKIHFIYCFDGFAIE